MAEKQHVNAFTGHARISDEGLINDLAPPHYTLMKCRRFAFLHTALEVLQSVHFDVRNVRPEYILKYDDPQSVEERRRNLGMMHDSAACRRLIPEMLSGGSIGKVHLESVNEDIVVLKMFAVVQDVQAKLARPIENGKPIKTLALRHTLH